jgi:large subunit ribosomal protein L6
VSRIGRMPISIPPGVEIKLANNEIFVKGPKGEMSRTFSPELTVALEGNQLIIQRQSDESGARALHGTTRSVINNMVTGVSGGFSKTLQIEGVGYRAEMKDKNLSILVGYSHPVEVVPPEGISFEVDVKARQIKVMGKDKELVGQIAANIRGIRPPEPYHGKGIRYLGEKVRRKAGKAGKAKA